MRTSKPPTTEEARLLRELLTANQRLLEQARERHDLDACRRLSERIEGCRQLLAGQTEGPRRRRRR